MFTGIITHQGIVEKRFQRDNQEYFVIAILPNEKGEGLVALLKLGSSIAVDGVCLTATDFEAETFSVQTMQETLKLTNLGSKKVGSKVNLELPLTLNQGIEGHLVLGHVDGRGEVLVSERKEDGNWVLQIKPPIDLLKYIAYKGSITINGVSLTVSKQDGDYFEVSLIDFTLSRTDLGDLNIGDFVNLEIDMLARYLERLTSSPTP